MKPDLRADVLLRDGRCVLSFLVPGHECKDRWGRVHPPDDLDSLTLEHVKDEPMMGRKAPDDERHLVAMCWAGNVGHEGSANRPIVREYLRGRYHEHAFTIPPSPAMHEDADFRMRCECGAREWVAA